MKMPSLIVPADRLASRRQLIAASSRVALSGIAVALLAGCEGVAAEGGKRALGNPADDVAVLNVALGLEYEAIAAYEVGLKSGLLQKPVLDVAVQFQGDHQKHAEMLAATIAKLGGAPVRPKANYNFPMSQLKDQGDVLRFAAELEKGVASVYLGAVPVFANKDLSKAAASIMGVETMHWAVLRNALAENPVPVAFIG